MIMYLPALSNGSPEQAFVHMDDPTVRRFHDSLDRCTRGPGFIEAFYDRFIGASDEIAVLFQGTNMASQRRKLQASLYVCMQAATGDVEAVGWCRRIAERHAGFSAVFYEVWLDALLATVREFDPKFDEKVEQAWRDMLQPGIDIFMEVAA